MKKFGIRKEPIVLKSETTYYQFDNPIKHGMKRTKFAKHEILDMIHIKQALKKKLQMTMSNMRSN